MQLSDQLHDTKKVFPNKFLGEEYDGARTGPAALGKRKSLPMTEIER
jgi:hypothetical protein